MVNCERTDLYYFVEILYISDADLEKIAVDPINKKLFYADTGNDFVASINLDGSGFMIVANGSVDEPRDVVVDPNNQ